MICTCLPPRKKPDDHDDNGDDEGDEGEGDLTIGRQRIGGRGLKIAPIVGSAPPSFNERIYKCQEQSPRLLSIESI